MVVVVGEELLCLRVFSPIVIQTNESRLWDLQVPAFPPGITTGGSLVGLRRHLGDESFASFSGSPRKWLYQLTVEEQYAESELNCR
jgi:hypothetical protein